MDYTNIIFIFATFWLVQGVFTFFQSRSMTKKMIELQTSYTGYLGVGVSKAKFNAGRGVIVALVTSEEGIVSDLQVMSGITVMARFKQKREYLGMSVEEMQRSLKQSKDKKMISALQQAIEKINDEREKNGLYRFALINN